MVRASHLLAWTVHAYTASGAVLAYLMVRATVAGDYRTAFLLMIVATVIDATDGWLARTLRVKAVVPWFDGARLDDIVDYLTFVFAPAVLIVHAGLVRGWSGDVAAVAVLVSSAYGFSRADAKTIDYFFTGFPSYWNVVAFYLYAAALPPLVNTAVLLGLAVMVFVPIRYVYPSRTPVRRTLTLSLAALWTVLLIVQVMWLPAVSMSWLLASLLYPLYYTALSLALQSRRRRAMLRPPER